MSTTRRASTDYAELIGGLDLASKVRLLTGRTMFTLWPEDSIGLGECACPTVPRAYAG